MHLENIVEPMPLRSVKTWLILLLSAVMVLGPWPVLSSASNDTGCCMMSGDMSLDHQHADCQSQTAQDDCCADLGCVGGQCAASAFIPSSADGDFSDRRTRFMVLRGDAFRAGSAPPPIPPPII